MVYNKTLKFVNKHTLWSNLNSIKSLKTLGLWKKCLIQEIIKGLSFQINELCQLIYIDKIGDSELDESFLYAFVFEFVISNKGIVPENLEVRTHDILAFYRCQSQIWIENTNCQLLYSKKTSTN